MEKEYGKWWDILFAFVSRRESAVPSNYVELTFYNGNQILQQQIRKMNVSQRKIKRSLRVYQLKQNNLLIMI